MSKKLKQPKQNIDVLVSAIEDFIDSKFEMSEADQYSDHKGYQKAYEKKYKPSKSNIKKFLTLCVSEMVNEKK